MPEDSMPEETMIEIEAVRAGAEAACALLKVLSNPDRLLLLCALAAGERNVGELEASLGIVQPTLSQQLAVLREAQLVSTRREGKNVYYQMKSAQAQAVMQVLYAQFCQPAKSRRGRQ